MPVLPLDHPLPLIATIGVMLYPGTDEEDRRNAASYAGYFLSEAYRGFLKEGGQATPEIESHLATEHKLPRDMKRRWRAGMSAGNIIKVELGLMQEKPALASSNHAVAVVSGENAKLGLPRSRANLWSAREKFKPVLHLWGALCIRDGNFLHRPDLGYSLDTDFQFFLYEAETISFYGRMYHADRDKAGTFLPNDRYHVPSSWEGPDLVSDYSKVPRPVLRYVLPASLTRNLRPAGRPKSP